MLYIRHIYKLNSYFPISIKCDGEPFFPHDITGIFVSKNAKIGKDCTIYQQVTIGSNDIRSSKHYGAPTIGDGVVIGAGAKIIGCVKIGNNVRIGANCVVVDDVPDNTTVVMSKPRVICRND